MTDTDPEPETDPDDNVRDFVEAIGDTYDDAIQRMTERSAIAIAEVNRLGLAWHNDPYLAPWCRHLGASMGRLASDLMIGFPSVRAAFKALLTMPTPTVFVTSLLTAHPGADDPKLQRELLAEAELSILCLERIMDMVTIPQNRVAAVEAFIDAIVDALAWMMDHAMPAPRTH